MTDDLQRSIIQYHKLLAEAFGQGDHYASNLDRIEGFTHDDVPNPYENYEEAYNAPNAMLDMDHYVNNSYDAESAVDSYNTYFGADLDFRDDDGNTVHRRVKK